MTIKKGGRGWQVAAQAVATMALALGAAPVAQAQLKILETDELQVVYFAPDGEYLVPYTIQTFLNSLEAQRTRFGYEPDGAITVLLGDFSDRGNAAALLGAPRNRIFLDIAPPIMTLETFSPGERLYAIANHELVHTLVGDQASDADRRARRLLSGKVAPAPDHPLTILYNYLTNPRASSPRWYQEGSAVFMETWYGGGLGRAQGGYDEMVFRAMVRDGASFYDPLSLVSKGTEVDFQTGANAYLYGTRFMSYLAHEYTPGHVIDWLRRANGTRRYYAADFERVFGRPLDTAWQEWIEWEREFQRANLASVREHPLTQHRDIGPRGLGAVSRSMLSKDGRTLYAGVRYPGRVSFLVAMDIESGKVRELAELKGTVPYRVTSLAYDGDSETLFYTTDNATYRNIEAYDLRTGRTRTLLERARIGDIAYNPADRSLWGLRTANGFVMLVRVPYPYDEWQAVHVYPFGETPLDLDVSPDGRLLSLSLAGPLGERSGEQLMQVHVLSTERLLAGDPTPLKKLEMGVAMPEGFVFSRDGRYLYGSSYYTGVSNVYRYEIATAKLEALTNAEAGYFRPVPLDDERLLVFHYAADGFVPATIDIRPTDHLSAISFLGERIASKHPEVQAWDAGPPGRVEWSSDVRRHEDYHPARELFREAVFPIVEGYKDSVAFGGQAILSDPLGFDSLKLTLSYSPDSDLRSRERLHASAVLKHYQWTVGLRWNGGDFYDLFGPKKRSREGWGAWVEFERPLLYDPPETLSLVGSLAYYGELDALPGFQNVASPVDRLGEAELGIVYRYPRGSIGKVDDETGHLWSLMAHAYEAGGEITPAVYGTFDVGWPLRLRHSSLWLRTAAGVASGDREHPFTNAYFGGFRNNYVDRGEPKRYREMLSMPGFEIDALGGRSFTKGMLEWNLPPIRFEGLGRPGFYGSWLRPALFTTALVTDPDGGGAFREEAFNVGVQFDLQLHVLHRLPMMLSFGYAKGFGGDDRGEDEFMLSLKVL